MKSDIFALGCVFYELVFAEKAFLNDYRLFEYTSSKNKLELPSFPNELPDDQSQVIVAQLILANLEIEFWRRPAARDLLQAMNSIREKFIPVYSAVRSTIQLDPHLEPLWKFVEWKPCWYYHCFGQ